MQPAGKKDTFVWLVLFEGRPGGRTKEANVDWDNRVGRLLVITRVAGVQASVRHRSNSMIPGKSTASETPGKHSTHSEKNIGRKGSRVCSIPLEFGANLRANVGAPFFPVPTSGKSGKLTLPWKATFTHTTRNPEPTLSAVALCPPCPHSWRRLAGRPGTAERSNEAKRRWAKGAKRTRKGLNASCSF